MYIHYDGCIHYIVEAENDEKAKEAALNLFSDEAWEDIIDRLEYDVCDCEQYD